MFSIFSSGRNSTIDMGGGVTGGTGGHITPVIGGWPTQLGADQSTTQKYHKKGKYHWHVVVDGLST